MKSTVRILVVEDALAVKKRLSLALKSAGFLIDTATNGKEAWEKSRREQFDFIITDEQMPIMSGRELCRRLRSDERYAQTPIIFLTAGRQKLDSKELMESLEVSAIFDKPFNPQLIVHFIEARLLNASGR